MNAHSRDPIRLTDERQLQIVKLCSSLRCIGLRSNVRLRKFLVGKGWAVYRRTGEGSDLSRKEKFMRLQLIGPLSSALVLAFTVSPIHRLRLADVRAL